MSETLFTPSGVWSTFRTLLDGGDINDNTATMRDINRTVNEAEELEELPEIQIDTAALFDPARKIVDPRDKQAKIGPVEPGQETKASEEFKSEGVARPTMTIDQYKELQPSFAASPVFGVIEKLQPDFQSQVMGGIMDFTSNTIEGVNALFNGGSDSRLANVARMIPTIEKSDKVGASLARGITQYSAAFIPAVGAVSKVMQGSGLAAKALVSDQVASAFADFFTQSGQDKRLSDLILKEMPGLRNWEHVGSLLEYLEGDPGDTELQGRFKNLVEGQLMNGLIGVVPNAKKIAQDFRMLSKEVQNMNFYRKYLDNQVGAIGQGVNKFESSMIVPAGKLTPEQEARKEIGDVTVNYQLASEAAVRKPIDKIKLTKDAKRKQIPIQELDDLSPEVKRSDTDRLTFFDAMSKNNRGLVTAGIKITKNFNDPVAISEFSQRIGDIPELMAKYVGEGSEVGKKILDGQFTGNSSVDRILQVADTYKNATPDQQRMFAEKMAGIPERKTMRYIRMTGAYLRTGKPWRKAAAEAFVSSLLAVPTTQIANITSNAISAVGLVGERAIAGGVSSAGKISPIPFLVDSPISVTESGYLAHGMLSSMRAGLRAFGEGWKKSFKGPGLIDLNNKVDAHMPAIAAEPLGLEGTMLGGLADFIGHVARLPLTNLSATDEFFKSVLRQGELQALAYREALETARQAERSGALNNAQFKEILDSTYKELVNNPTDELVKRSDEFAHFGTFTSKFTSDKAKSFQSMMNETPELKLIVPFWQTPVRVAQANLKRVPLIGGLMSDPQELAASSVAERQALSFAKQAVGAMVGTLSATLAYNQKIIGNGPAKNDTKSRDLMAAKGLKPLSIPTKKDEKGNILESIPISKLTGQYGVMLRLGADVTDITRVMWEKLTDGELTAEAKEAYDDYITGYISTTSDIFKDQVFFKNVIDMIDGLENGNTSAVERMIASPLPRMVEEVAKVFDNKVKEMDTLKELFMSKIPGLRGFVASKSDLFGQDYIDGMGTFAEQNQPKLVAWLATRFNPAQATGNFNPEMQPVFDYFGQFTRVLPNTDGDKKEISNIRLDSEQRTAFKKVRAGSDYETSDGRTIEAVKVGGLTLNERLLDIVTDDSLDDIVKISSINRFVEAYGQLAEQSLLGHYEDLDKEVTRQRELGTAIQQAVNQ